MRFEELTRADNSTLENCLLQGKTPCLQDLVDREFDGWNTNRGTVLFGNRKFRKGFIHNSDGSAAGYNVKVKQNQLEEPWIANSKLPFGFYDTLVDPSTRYQQLSPYKHTIMLDYGKDPRNGLLDGKFLRDVLVEVQSGLYLGKAYHAFAGKLISLSYFVLKPAEN